MAESQLRKGAIELVVLGALDKAPAYGGELIERLREETGLELSTGTLYPLLARLRKAGLVETSWAESPVGPPRKIYTLSVAGKTRLRHLKNEWDELASAVARAVTRKNTAGKGEGK